MAQPGTGRVQLRLKVAAGQIARVDVSVERPTGAALLAGRTPGQARSLISLLYAVCANAHAAAAAAAIAAAREGGEGSATSCAVAGESLRELVLNVLSSSHDAVPELVRGLASGPPGALGARLFGMPAELWLQIDNEADLANWARMPNLALAAECRRRLATPEPGAARLAFLPALTARESLGVWALLDASFALAPTWCGRPACTGSIARVGHRALVRALADRPLLAHWVARVTELALAGSGGTTLLGRVTHASVQPGTGRAIVETARGSLIHEAELAGDTIQRYVIVAPTEWNFHARGLIPAWLTGWPATGDADVTGTAHRCAAALDPCVECEVTVSPADER